MSSPTRVYSPPSEGCRDDPTRGQGPQLMLNHFLLSDLQRAVSLMLTCTCVLGLLSAQHLQLTQDFLFSAPQVQDCSFRLSYWGYSFLNDKNGNFPPSDLHWDLLPPILSLQEVLAGHDPGLPQIHPGPWEVHGFPQDQGFMRVLHSHPNLQGLLHQEVVRN